jgi:hypothetical protein
MGVPGIQAGFDFTDPDLYARRVPAAEFALRLGRVTPADDPGGENRRVTAQRPPAAA